MRPMKCSRSHISRLIGSRSQFHTSLQQFKNPYYIYDLIGAQPTTITTTDESQLGAETGHMVFDPRGNFASNETMRERAAKVFGDLGSREASRQEANAKAVNILGIKIPAPPEEPTNCCMSGCVNCVWELYKDEIAERNSQIELARSKLLEKQHIAKDWPPQLGPEPANRRVARGLSASASDIERVESSVESSKGVDQPNLSVGIEVFIATEKRIRARRNKMLAARASAPASSS